MRGGDNGYFLIENGERMPGIFYEQGVCVSLSHLFRDFASLAFTARTPRPLGAGFHVLLLFAHTM